MFATIYFAAFLLSFVLLVLLLSFYKKETNIYFLLIFVSVSIALLGYAGLYFKKDISDDLPLALYANILTYIGGCFTPVLMFECISEICGFKKSRYLTIVFLIVSTFIFLMVTTTSYHKLFYTNVELVDRENYTFLKKTYGPLHTFYIIHLLIVMCSCIAVTINAYFKSEQVSIKNSILMTILIIISTMTFTIQKLFKSEFEFIPFTYVLSEIVFLIVLYRLRLYEVATVTANTITNDSSHGFVVLDKKHQYLGSNSIAKQWFPEVSKLHVDHHIDESTEFLKLIHSFCIGSSKSVEEIVKSKDSYIKVSFKELTSNHKKTIAYLILCEDDTANQKYLRLISSYNINLEKEVSKKTEHLKNIQNDIIYSMGNIVENRDLNTGGHIKRTSQCVKIFVERLIKENTYPEISKDFYIKVTLAAPLHDFGKIAIPDVILNKNGKFTPEEYEIMKTHPEKGAKIVGEILQNVDDEEFRKIAINIAYYHHEKVNGQGYPTGKKDDEIPFEARIMALADVFDALVSKRCYKEKYSYDKAFDIIKESTGTHFDKKLAEVFIKCRKELEEFYDKENC